MKPTPARIAAVAAGKRWCSGCGEPKIDASEPWKTSCSECFHTGKTAEFCCGCGDELDSRMRGWCRSKRRKSGKCLYCRLGYTIPHPSYGAKVPPSWFVWNSSPRV